MEDKITCPNSECATNTSNAVSFIASLQDEKFYVKKGYYTTKYNHQPVPRYKCKYCGRYFSSHTSRETYRQHKPHINEAAFKLLASAVTMRRAAKILGVAKLTIERKFHYLAARSLAAHTEFLNSGAIKTSYVQFDEMETYEHTKCKPLSVALAIRPKKNPEKTPFIIDISVAKMRCKGKLAGISKKKYPEWNEDNREECCKEVMQAVRKVAKPDITIASDAKKAYPNIIKSVLPNAKIEQYPSRAKAREFDPLFMLNHTAARIRADLSRMRRRTWACTKKWENLLSHLYIYIAWNNGYKISWNFS